MIDFKKTKQYTLSIRLSTDGFCFAVHNPQAVDQYAYQPYRIDTLKSITANLKAAIESTELLRHNYGEVNILLSQPPYTLVPKEYYAEQCAHDIYVQNFPQAAPNTQVLTNIVSEEQTIVLFGMEHQLHKFITERYPKAKIYASISPLIEHAVEKSYAQSGKPYCLAHLHKRGTDLLCISNGALQFANTFDNPDTGDAIYYLLNCWQMLGLSQTDDTLHIAGTARHAKALTNELGRFIKHIHTVRPAEEFHSTELARIDEIPFDLQTLLSCE